MNAAAQAPLNLIDTRPTQEDAQAESSYLVNVIAGRLNGEYGAVALIEDVASRLPQGQHRADVESDCRRLTELLERAENVARELAQSVRMAAKLPSDIASAVAQHCEARQ